MANEKKYFKLLKDKINGRIHKNEAERKEKTKLRLNFFIKYFLLFSLIIILFIFFNYLFQPGTPAISLAGFNGNVFTKKNEYDDYKKINELTNLDKKNYFIKTGKKSLALIYIGRGCTVSIKEKSELRILKAETFKNNEDCYLYLLNGSADFSIKLKSENSNFEVQSEMLKLKGRGTKFFIKISEEKNVNLKVEEGKVYARLNDLKEIVDFENNLNMDNSEKFENLFNEEIEIGKGENFVVKHKDFNYKNKEKLKIINSIKKELDENPDYNIEEELIDDLRNINQGIYKINKIS